MAPEILERELPADPYQILPNREELVREYLHWAFSNDLSFYPSTGLGSGMPTSLANVVSCLHCARGRDISENSLPLSTLMGLSICRLSLFLSSAPSCERWK